MPSFFPQLVFVGLPMLIGGYFFFRGKGEREQLTGLAIFLVGAVLFLMLLMSDWWVFTQQLVRAGIALIILSFVAGVVAILRHLHSEGDDGI